MHYSQGIFYWPSSDLHPTSMDFALLIEQISPRTCLLVGRCSVCCLNGYAVFVSRFSRTFSCRMTGWRSGLRKTPSPCANHTAARVLMVCRYTLRQAIGPRVDLASDAGSMAGVSDTPDERASQLKSKIQQRSCQRCILRAMSELLWQQNRAASELSGV
jgi:hypothetical protein